MEINPDRVKTCATRFRGRSIQHDEAAAADVFLSNQVEAGLGLTVRRHNDVLQQVAQARFDRALVLRLDVEIIRHRTLLAHVAVGLRQHHARRFRVAGPRGLEIGERCQACRQAGELALTRPQIVRFPFELDARARQLGFARRFRVQEGLGRVFRPAQPVGGRRAIAFESFVLHAHFGLFHVEFRELFRHPLRRFFGVLNRMAQSRCDVERRKHFGSRRFDVRFEAFDAPVLVGVFRFDPHQLGGGLLLVALRRRSSLLPFEEQHPSGLAPRLERGQLCPHFFGARGERRNLLAVEFDLLLAQIDVELAGVDRLAGAGRLRFGFDEGHANAAEIRLGLGNGCRCGRLALVRAREPRAQRLDLLRRLLIAAGKQQLLPMAQLVAQPLVAARFRDWRLSDPNCFSSSKIMSSRRVRFSVAASSFSSAARRRALYLVMPAASSMSCRRSAGRELRIMPIFPCSMMA